MEWVLKICVFAGPVVLAGMMRTVLLVARGGPELALYDADKARLFDVSIDLLLASTSILLGLLLYSKSSTLNKPGTNTPITHSDIIYCCGAQMVALILILFCTFAMPHFVSGDSDWMTIWLPDLFGAIALIWSMAKLA